MPTVNGPSIIRPVPGATASEAPRLTGRGAPISWPINAYRDGYFQRVLIQRQSALDLTRCVGFPLRRTLSDVTIYRRHLVRLLIHLTAMLFVVLIGGSTVEAQFKRPASPMAKQPVSARIKLTIMTRPADNAECGMLAFSPDGTTLYFGSKLIGAIPARPLPPRTERNSGGSVASAAVTATSKEVDDGVVIGKREILPRESIESEGPVVLGGSIVNVEGRRQPSASAICVYRVNDGKLVRVYQPMQTKRPQRGEVCDWGLLSYDGKYLACFGKVDVFLTMYDTGTNRILFQVPRTQLMFKGGWGAWAAFTQDSSAIMTVREGTLFMYNARTGILLDKENIRNRDGISGYSRSLHTSRTATRFFYGTSVWNAETAELIAPSVNPKDGDTQRIKDVTADGTILLGADNSSVFAVGQGEHVVLQNGFRLRDSGVIAEPWVNAVAITDDGRLYAAAFGSKIFLGSPRDAFGPLRGAILDTIEGHLQSVDGLTFSRDGSLLASTSTDGSTRIWDVSDLTSASDVAAKPTDRPQPIPRGQWHDWGPEQAIGPPDTQSDAGGRTAWSPSTSHNANDWLLLEYETPLSPTAVVVYELNIPGGVRQITLIDDQAQERTVWTNDVLPPRDNVAERARVLRIPVDTIADREYRFVRLDMHGGWNEIDAVGIETSDGRVRWATRADASTSYGRSDVHSSLQAIYPKSDEIEFAVGDAVEVRKGSTWYKAKVLKVGGPSRWRIRYDGYDAKYDKTVGKDRIRNPDTDGSVTERE